MDIRIDNPVGRVPDPTHMRSSTLTLTTSGWRLGRRQGAWGGSLESALPLLDTRHQLVVAGNCPNEHQAELSHFIERAILRGTFVLSDTNASGLDEATRSTLETADAVSGTRSGDLAWDVRAVAQRRAILRPLLEPLPEVSAVLVSRRPDLVTVMVRRISQLAYPNLEIVVGMHGAPAPAGLVKAAGNRPLTVHEFDKATVFGSVIDQTFARASGRLVTKIDDDDHYADDHIWDLVAAHAYSGATLVGKTTTVVYLEALDATVRRLYGNQENYTHRVAGGTMLLSADDLAEVGGWPAVPRGVDTALIDAIRSRSGSIYLPHDIGYLYIRQRDSSSHTWDAGIGHFLRNTREQWVGLLAHEAFGTDGQ